MGLPQLLATSAAVVLGYVGLLWLLSLWKRDSSIVDSFWGAGFALQAAVYAWLADGYEPRKMLALALVAIWAMRLSVRIFSRNWGRGEDERYRAWREAAGAKYWWVSFFQVFLVQGALMWVIAAPLLAAEYNVEPARLTAFDWIGAGLWGVGLFFEAVGDWQLDRFKANPANKNKVLDSGLWRYTRHPNYFGDAMVWWGYFVIALGTPFGWVTIFSPVLMTVLLVRVSGVALLEKSLVERKPGYREYVERTSAFWPWPPRGT